MKKVLLVLTMFVSLSAIAQEIKETPKPVTKDTAAPKELIYVLKFTAKQLEDVLAVIEKSNAPHDQVVRPVQEFLWAQIRPQIPQPKVDVKSSPK